MSKRRDLSNNVVISSVAECNRYCSILNRDFFIHFLLSKVSAKVQHLERISQQLPDINLSHSIVAGGLPEMSYTTRDTPDISLMMRREERSRKS